MATYLTHDTYNTSTADNTHLSPDAIGLSLINSYEIGLKDKNDLILPCGIVSRWEGK